jgi:hypothetical protein
LGKDVRNGQDSKDIKKGMRQGRMSGSVGTCKKGWDRKGCQKELEEEEMPGRVRKEGMSGRLLREEGTLEERREGMGCQAVWGRKEFLERVGRIRDVGKGWKRRNVRTVITT